MAIRKIRGLEYDLVRLFMIVNIYYIGLKLYKNPIKSFRVVGKLVQNFTKMIGGKKLVRAYKLDGKYVWDMFNPAWPSKGFSSFFRGHLIEIESPNGNQNSLRRLLIAITKRCPLQCEHCSESDTLYQKDVLSLTQFKEVINPFVKNGVGQLVYSGGEPLSRFEDLLELISNYKNDCEQWIYTSAFGLTLEKAQQLKDAGLNGAAISLDHHLESKHNAFRGNSKSFYWVLEGIKNLNKVGVLVSLNVCATKEYIESGQVSEIIELAKKLNVSIVNFLEPRAVGNYFNKDVELNKNHKEILANFSHSFNFDKSKYSYPTVLFPASYRENMPCGGGKSYLLLDYDGSLYPCPFCKVKMPKIRSKQDNFCKAEI